MRTFNLLLYFALLIPTFLSSQSLHNYFDGGYNPSTLVIEFGSDSSNIWEIGAPQKTLFNLASTLPNALMTDTIDYIPVNNTSSFEYKFGVFGPWTMIAIQWKQMLDLDDGKDFANIEFSKDGLVWQSAFDNPYVYSFYGFDKDNVDTLANGEIYFTGTDATWRDLWLCLDPYWVQDTLRVRHTIICDSIDNNNEGWMIDNMWIHNTLIHTNKEVRQDNYILASPNPTTGRVHITTKKQPDFHIIEKMELSDATGRLVKQWENVPTKFFIDIDEFPDGTYFLQIQTNKDTETVKLSLQK